MSDSMNENRHIFIALTKLGEFLRDFCDARVRGKAKSFLEDDPKIDGPPKKDDVGDGQNAFELNDWSQKLDKTIALAGHKNGWFTEENILFALKNWGDLLKEDTLSSWLSAYDINKNRKKTVAVIMAGNIPLVGLHDLLAVLITGNLALIKLSSNDKVLISFIKDYLVSIEPLCKERIHIPDGKLESFDAVIATGSNNTARYFEHYFGKVPNIIRKNRNSVAVLTGDESAEQLKALGEDIFRYYGLGCRSVSKLFVPNGYDFDTFFTSIFDYDTIIEHNKYANNYDYNKAVYLMSDFKILDNGFLVLNKDESYASPIASLFYENYSSMQQLQERLKKDADQLQCIVGDGIVDDEIPFGETQNPALSDYADGVDTVEFLLRN